jgi:predicted dehydrogenase
LQRHGSGREYQLNIHFQHCDFIADISTPQISVYKEKRIYAQGIEAYDQESRNPPFQQVIKMTITYGIIGTNWITTSWILSAAKTKQWTLGAVYSRTLSQAKDFGQKHNCNTSYDTLDALAADSSLQAIYIASPNSLHYAHATQMLEAGKHVILEKPATSTPRELDALFALAARKGVYLIEAYRHIQEANFKRLRSQLVEEQRLGRIYGASFGYASWSSRYWDVLTGSQPVPNIFSLEFSGGSLVDIGVYPITFAVALFGAPSKQTYVPFMTKSGVDGGGVGILHYEGFGVQINASKGYRSAALCEIYGEKGTFTINAVFDVEKVEFWDPKTKETSPVEVGPVADYDKGSVNMLEEAQEFARIINEKDEAALKELERISRIVIGVTSDMRKQGGVIYPADKE